MILVQKKAAYTCLHMHTAAASTWIHAGHVKKNDIYTQKQTEKNVATKKSNLSHKQSYAEF